MPIDFRKNVSDPYAVDLGNKTMQSRTASKTIQFGMFTTNANAVWGAKQQLQKESYPFGVISFPANRDVFRYEVGDVFLWSYAKYGISNMVCRVLQIEEENLESENIIIHAMQDIYSATNVITEYTDPTDNATPPTDYTITPFTKQTVLEAPYVLSETTKIIPLACRESALDAGFYTYMSVDNGASYSLLGTSTNLQPYGTLQADYGITYTIDEITGFEIDFKDDGDLIESVTWADVYSGNRNLAVLGDEIISFKTITPVSGTVYQIDDIVRGRYGTVKKEHSLGEDFWFLSKSVNMFADVEILPGADRKFKLVPYNVQKSGTITTATAIDLTIEGESSKPYEPINFNANGESFNPLYVGGTDITLTWSVRKRGEGCGIGIPGAAVIPGTDHEGLFKIEVYVSSSLVRTTTSIDAATWNYTNAMNVADNGTAADEITFLIYNYISGTSIFEADAVQVICYREGAWAGNFEFTDGSNFEFTDGSNFEFVE